MDSIIGRLLAAQLLAFVFISFYGISGGAILACSSSEWREDDCYRFVMVVKGVGNKTHSDCREVTFDSLLFELEERLVRLIRILSAM